MSEMIIRPTMKFIYIGFAIMLLIVAAAVAAAFRVQWPPWIPSPLHPFTYRARYCASKQRNVVFRIGTKQCTLIPELRLILYSLRC